MTISLSEVNLNRLVIFVRVVEAGSLTGAANRLGTAKTMVSAHMQKLEVELGTNLLVRTTRRLALTEAGEAFYEAARGIVLAAEDAVHALGRDTAELRGTLRITAPVDYSGSVIAPLAVKIGRQHPALKIELLSGDRVFDLIADGIDVAVRLGKLADSTYQAVRVADLSSWLVAAPEVVAAAGKLSRPTHLAPLPFISLSVLAQPLSWTFHGPGGKRERVHLQTQLSANTAHATRAAALVGGGLAILPEFAVSDDVARGRLVRILPKWSVPTGGVFAVFPATRYRPQKVRVFVDALRQHLAPQTLNSSP